MEFGRPPGKLIEKEKQDIMKWAYRKGFSTAGGQGVIRKIQKKGIGIGKTQVIETPNTEYTETAAVLAPYEAPNGTFRPFLRPAIHKVTSNLAATVLREI